MSKLCEKIAELVVEATSVKQVRKYGYGAAKHDRILLMLVAEAAVAWIKKNQICDVDALKDRQKELTPLLESLAFSLVFNPWMNDVHEYQEASNSLGDFYKAPINIPHVPLIPGGGRARADFRKHPVHPRLLVFSGHIDLLDINFMGNQPSDICNICREFEIEPIYLLYVELLNILKFKASEKAHFFMLTVSSTTPSSQSSSKQRQRLAARAASLIKGITRNEPLRVQMALFPIRTPLILILGAIAVTASFSIAIAASLAGDWGVAAAAVLMLLPSRWLYFQPFSARLNSLECDLLRAYDLALGRSEGVGPPIAQLDALVSRLNALGEVLPREVHAILALIRHRDIDLRADYYERSGAIWDSTDPVPSLGLWIQWQWEGLSKRNLNYIHDFL